MLLKRLSKKVLALVCILAIISSAFSIFKLSPAEAEEDPNWHHEFTREELAYRWAPVWYQNTAEKPRWDYITRFDYDGDWAGDNNWENVDDDGVDMRGYIYYSVVETSTHWFIGYYDFHPKDWDSDEYWDTDEHENDMEGALVVIRRSGGYGNLISLITSAHNDFYQYGRGSVTDGHEDIDGNIEFTAVGEETDHPNLYVQSGGHGVYGDEDEAGHGFWAADWGEHETFPGGDGIIYYPSAEGASEPNGGAEILEAFYELIDIQVFWDRRFGPYGKGQTFEDFGVLASDDASDGSGAHLPWRWDDGDDGDTYTGEFFYDPADMVDVHLNNLAPFDHKYSYNPYAVEVTINSYAVWWDLDPPYFWENEEDDRSDPYVKLYMFDGEGREILVLDGGSGSQKSWKGNNIHATWIDMETELRRSYFYGIRYPNKPFFGIESREWDDPLDDPGDLIGFDDWLMHSYPDGKDEECYAHWYGEKGTPNYEGRAVGIVKEGFNDNLHWYSSQMKITLLGDVPDDDTVPPQFPEPPNPYPTYPGDRIAYTYPGDIIFKVKIHDDSGISEVYFDYRVGLATEWNEITVQRYNPDKPQQPEDREFEYSMPRSVWVQYAGQTILFRWRAIDNDIDREGDRLEGFSHLYWGPKISSLVGTHPYAQHNAVAFETSETEEGQDLDGDGYVDNDDTVIRYLDTVSWNVTNTGVVGERPSLFWPIIAFQVNEASVDQDLNGDYDKNDYVIHYYNMSSKETTNTAIAGLYPSISGNIIAFQTIDNIVEHYDISTQETYTIDAGKHPSISQIYEATIDKDLNGDGDKIDDAQMIAYESSEGRIKYCPAWGSPFDTLAEGREPSISGGFIAFEASKQIKYYDIKTDSTVNTYAVGEHPSTNGEIIVFETYEPDVGEDLNGDGVQDDRVIRTYHIKSGEVANTGLVGECPSCPIPLALLGGVTTYFMAFQQNETSVGVDLNYDGDQNDHAILFIPQTVYTPSGPNIEQRFKFIEGAIISDIVLNYLEVRGLGGATLVLPRLKGIPGLLSTTPPSPIPAPKGGRILGDPFDITTTADVVGSIGITINYDPTGVMNEENLGILEFNTNTNQWNDITTGIDLINHRITGESPGFSTFALVEWTGATQPQNIFVGQEPSVDGNIIAFLTSELEAGMDLNGDGNIDDARVIQYYDLLTKTLTNTGENAEHLSISGDIIAFTHYDYDAVPWVYYYNITKGTAKILEIVGEHPSVSGNVIAFQTPESRIYRDLNGDGDMNDNIIQYFNIITREHTNTGVVGEDPSISGDIIAFTNYEYAEPTPMYYDIAEGTAIGPEVSGEHPSVSGNVIAFQTPEIYGDLNGDGDMNDNIIQYFYVGSGRTFNTLMDGTYPSVSGNIIAFITEEEAADEDLNHDGDILDSFLQYYDISTGQITNTAEAASKASVCGNIFAFSTPEDMINQDLNGDGDTDDTVIRYSTKAIPQPALPPTSGLDLLVAPLGGAVTNLARKAAVEIPAGALLEDTIVTVDAIPEEQYSDFLYENMPNIVSTEVYKIGPCDITLTQFAQFTLTYDETKVGETELQQLQVYSSTDGENWQREQVQFIDRDLNVIRLWTNHFGYFVILRDTEPATTELTIGTPQDIDSEGNIHIWPSTNLTLTATDALSLPMYTYYRINNKAWTLYENPFTITGESGTCTIDYFTVDFARNCETFKSTTVILEVHTTMESCDSTGTKKDTFDITESVYATGSGYSPDTTYNIYVVEDVITWTDGMAIPTRVPGTTTTVTTDADGNITATLIWNGSLIPGNYDIVVDYDGDGTYDQDTDALDNSDVEVTAGFNVIPDVPLGTAIAIFSMIGTLGAFLGTKRPRTKPIKTEKRN